MTDIKPRPPLKSLLPDTGRGYWRIVLIASLMANLLVLGAVLGSRWKHPRFGLSGQGIVMQFLPQKFFAELSADRRKVLATKIKAGRPKRENILSASTATAKQIAEALMNADYDQAKTNALIDSITTGPDSPDAKRGALLKSIYAELTAEERQYLSRDIQDYLQRWPGN